MRRTFTLTCLVFLAAACWQRQDHTITNPEWPHYTLSGYTVDLDDTTQALPNTPVTLVSYKLLYEVDFITTTVQSDSGGYFQIDSVFPGAYIVTCQRDGYTVSGAKLFIAHEDRWYDLHLPKTMVSVEGYLMLDAGANPRIAWGHQGLYVLGRHQIGSEGPSNPAILLLKRETGLMVTQEHHPNPVPDAANMTFVEGLFYLGYMDTVTVLSALDFGAVATHKVNPYFRGAAWADSVFWTTLGNRLQVRGKTLKTVAASYETQAEILGPLTHDGDHFWSYDTYRGLVLKLDPEGRILASYRSIDSETGRGIEVYDLDFQLPGRLWATDKQRRKLYRFQAR